MLIYLPRKIIDCHIYIFNFYSWFLPLILDLPLYDQESMWPSIQGDCTEKIAVTSLYIYFLLVFLLVFRSIKLFVRESMRVDVPYFLGWSNHYSSFVSVC